MAGDEQSKDKATSANSDIESIEVEILIICKSPAGFQQAAGFLNRRGWPTTVVGNLSKAIDFIVKSQPDFVLISSNHPNPGTLRLPSLLAASMNAQTIGFAELSDASSAARLATLPFPHKIQGGASGPNIYRAVRRILMDTIAKGRALSVGENQGATGKAAPADSGPTSNAPTGQGESDPDMETTDMGSYRVGRSKERLRLKDITSRSQGWEAMGQAPKMQVDKKVFAELLSAPESRGESGMILLPSAVGEDMGSDRDISYGPKAQDDLGSVTQTGPEAKAGKDFILRGEPNGESSSIIQTGLKERVGGPLIQTGLEAKEFCETQQGPRGESFQVTQPGYKGPGPKITAIQTRASGVKSGVHQGLLAQAMEQSLQKICSQAPERDMAIDYVDTLAILPVDSSEIHGYIVIAASGVNAEQQMEFIREFRPALQELVEKLGLPAKIEDGFVISLEQFSFHEWVKNEAAIGFFASHGGSQLAATFIATDARLPQAIEGELPNMAKIRIEEIDPDHPVPFKAYLHLQQNDRFFLYLRNGRRLYPEQKSRLLEKSVADFYIKLVDVSNYKTYSAANYLLKATRPFRAKRTG